METGILKTGCILDSTTNDGVRVSVMSRHTLNDGVTANPEITHRSYDLWLPQLGPPATLIGAYYKRGLPWQDFEAGYVEHLRRTETLSSVDSLIELAKNSLVTVLCIEKSPEKCHRRLLANHVLMIDPAIRVDIF